MNYFCKIKEVIEELEITLDIAGILIKGFDVYGTLLSEGDECLVEINFFDDVTISEVEQNVPSIIQGTGFKYSFVGRLDFNKRMVKSLIDIELEEEELFGSSYLDGKMVRVDVKRVDFVFLENRG